MIKRLHSFSAIAVLVALLGSALSAYAHGLFPQIVLSASTGTETTYIFQVNNSNDDANEDGVNYSSSNPEQWLGNGASTDKSYLGLRFNGVAIPKNAVITAAYLDLYSTQDQWINLSVQIGMEAIGNSDPFSATRRMSQLVLTSTKVDNNSNVKWSANGWYSFSDITSVVQELVNRSDWQSGNSVAIVLKGTGTQYGRKFIASFDSNPGSAPRFVVHYMVAGSSTPTPLPTQIPTSTPIPTPIASPTPSIIPTSPPSPSPVVTPIPTPIPTPIFTSTPIPTPTSLDKTAPSIYSVAATNPTPFSMTINWTTNEPADSQVEFCLTSSHCNNNTPIISSLQLNHSINLFGLTPQTRYYYWVKSRDAVGNLAISYRRYFVTSSSITPTPVPTPTPVAGDTKPPIISNILVTNIGQFSANISWTTDEASDGQVEFMNPCPSTGCLTPVVSTLVTSHLINIFNLSPGTTYHYVIKSKDASGNLSVSLNQYFTTLSPTPTPTPVLMPTPAPILTPTPMPSTAPSADVYPESMSMHAWRVGGKNAPNPLYDKCDDGTDIVLVHNQYYVIGYDGIKYPTWHPPVVTNPITGVGKCYFGHEHGTDPQTYVHWNDIVQHFGKDINGDGIISAMIINPLTGQITPGDRAGIPFGIANEHMDQYYNQENRDSVFVRHEDHVGHKIEVANYESDTLNNSTHTMAQLPGTTGINVPYYKAGSETYQPTGIVCTHLHKFHQGTHSPDAVRNNLHEVIFHSTCTSVDTNGINAPAYYPSNTVILTGMMAFGNPGEYLRFCFNDRMTKVCADGKNPDGTCVINDPLISKLPKAIYSDTLGRNMVDKYCLDNFSKLNPGLNYFNPYELWQGDLRIQKADGDMLAEHGRQWDVLDPVRFIDSTSTTGISYNSSQCASGGAFSNIQYIGGCNSRTQNIPWDSPLSGFRGLKRTTYFGRNRVSNPGGPDVWWTDPLGGNASPTQFTSGLKQRISPVEADIQKVQYRIQQLYGPDNFLNDRAIQRTFNDGGGTVHAPN